MTKKVLTMIKPTFWLAVMTYKSQNYVQNLDKK